MEKGYVYGLEKHAALVHMILVERFQLCLWVKRRHITRFIVMDVLLYTVQGNEMLIQFDNCMFPFQIEDNVLQVPPSTSP